MIDETLLTRALDEAGAVYDEPPGARDAIVAAADLPRRSVEATGVRPPLWRRPLPVAASVVALAAAVAVAVAVRPTPERAAPASRLTENAGTAALDSSAGAGADPPLATVPRPAPAPLAATDGKAGTTTSGTSGGTSIGGGQAAPAPQPPPAGAPAAPAAQPESLAKVIKTGTVEILVADGQVSATLGRLTTLAAGVRGFVADSKTTESGDAPSGVVTMRVPGSSYEQTVTRVRALGEVRAATSTGEDVTAAFVDTEARLRTLRSTLAVYETLLARARSIGEVLAVQQQINGAQTQIEQLEGKLKVLTDQVTYATLTVSVGEKSAEAELAAKEPGRLGAAVDRAKDNFGDGLEWVIAASGTVALLALCLGALVGLAWSARRLLRRRLV